MSQALHELTSPAATGVHLSAANARYLAAKVSHISHTLDLPLAGELETA